MTLSTICKNIKMLLKELWEEGKKQAEKEMQAKKEKKNPTSFSVKIEKVPSTDEDLERLEYEYNLDQCIHWIRYVVVNYVDWTAFKYCETYKIKRDIDTFKRFHLKALNLPQRKDYQTIIKAAEYDMFEDKHFQLLGEERKLYRKFFDEYVENPNCLSLEKIKNRIDDETLKAFPKDAFEW